jgi:hypothetical protein
LDNNSSLDDFFDFVGLGYGGDVSAVKEISEGKPPTVPPSGSGIPELLAYCAMHHLTSGMYAALQLDQ